VYGKNTGSAGIQLTEAGQFAFPNPDLWIVSSVCGKELVLRIETKIRIGVSSGPGSVLAGFWVIANCALAADPSATEPTIATAIRRLRFIGSCGGAV